MRRNAFIPLGVFLAALTAYVITLAPGAVGGDAGEMQFVPAVLGIAHWTGYPLYTMFGKLWGSLVPLGSIAYRMNLLSAVASAGCAALVCIAARRLTGSWAAGVLAALVLSTSSLFWNWAIVAGVRSVTVFFAVLNIALALEWAQAERDRRANADRLLLLLALAYGLSLAHHRTTIFLAPALFIFLLWSAPSLLRRWRLWLRAALIVIIVPSLLYLYIPIRSAMNPPYAIDVAYTLKGFITVAFAPGLQVGVAQPLTLSDLPPRIMAAAQQFQQEFTLPLALLGVVGLVWLLVRRPRAAVLLLIPFLFMIAFTINYNLGGSDLNIVYLLPAFAIFSLWIACGAAAIAGVTGGFRADFVGSKSSEQDRIPLPAEGELGRGIGSSSALPLLANTTDLRGARRLAKGIALALVALYVLILPARATWQQVSAQEVAPLDGYRFPLRGEQGQRLIDLGLPVLPDGAMLIGDWEQLTPFWYGQLVEGKTANLTFHYPVEPDWQTWVAQARQAGQRVFLARRSDTIVGQHFLTGAGPLVEMRTSPAHDVPAGLKASNTPFGDQLELMGYSYPGLAGSALQRRSVLSLQLYWRALRQMTTNYSVSVRLVAGDGTIVSSIDNTHPVLSMYPTSLWQAGEVVGDFYELMVPQALAAGTYHVEIIVYGQDGGVFRNLTVPAQGGPSERLALDPLTIR